MNFSRFYVWSLGATLETVYGLMDRTYDPSFASEKVLSVEKISPDWQRKSMDLRLINGLLVCSSIEIAYLDQLYLFQFHFL